MERDREVNEKLNQEGWVVIRFWGKDIKNNLDECIEAYKFILPLHLPITPEPLLPLKVLSSS